MLRHARNKRSRIEMLATLKERNCFMNNKTLIAAIIVLLSAGMAHAAPLTWTLANVSFEDGGTADGSFVYDADTDTYSAISITTTAGTLVTPGHTYGFPHPLIGSSVIMSTVTALGGGDLTNEWILFLEFDGWLTNAGGTVPIKPFTVTPYVYSFEAQSLNASGTSLTDGRNILSASGSVSAVPEPATLSLVAIGALGMIARRKRK